MKGVILAGGSGSRLFPLTVSVNKHLLPIGQKPMVLHCVDKMVESGVTDILIVTNPEYVGHFSMFLKSGKNFGCNLTYKTQDHADGVAGALLVAEDFVGDDNCLVILGDNMFEFDLKKEVSEFNGDCHLFFKSVVDGHRYGVGHFDGTTLTELEEKPNDVTCAYACVGIYMFGHTVFNIIKGLSMSDRGEYEIADVINEYISIKNISYSFISGFWTDAGTLESYRLANENMYE